MPFFLIESVYENEHNATDRRLRTDAYHAVVSRAAGQAFGNNPMWHFDGPGLDPAPVTWQEALGSEGSQSMTHLRELLADISWWLLETDLINSFLLTSRIGRGFDRAVATRAADRSFRDRLFAERTRDNLGFGATRPAHASARTGTTHATVYFLRWKDRRSRQRGRKVSGQMPTPKMIGCYF
jgi:hypothetical protein